MYQWVHAILAAALALFPGTNGQVKLWLGFKKEGR